MKTIHLILSVFVFSGILSCNSKYKLSGQPGPPMGGNPDQVEAYQPLHCNLSILYYTESFLQHYKDSKMSKFAQKWMVT